MTNKLFPWHEKPLAEVESALEADRLTHALLIEGPEGVGKLGLAFAIARRVLGLAGDAPDPLAPPVHADLLWITREEGERGLKKQIGIDQVRAACRELAMTSYAGGWKVAVIAPADRLTPAAANSLLKTLEEPAPETLLILVRTRRDTLPATIASRCQRLLVNPPAPEQALEWLQANARGKARWDRLLAMAGGAPLLAIRLREEGFETLDETLDRGLREVVAGVADPVELAARTGDREPADVLRWLDFWVGELIRLGAAGPRPELDPKRAEALQKVLQRIPLPRLFRYLDELRAASTRLDGALNAQLVMENLLTPWADALEPTRGASEQGVLADR
ncbi:MAG: hypothetical protein P8080_02045 [Gammaproteobacteria bacterium]